MRFQISTTKNLDNNLIGNPVLFASEHAAVEYAHKQYGLQDDALTAIGYDMIADEMGEPLFVHLEWVDDEPVELDECSLDEQEFLEELHGSQFVSPEVETLCLALDKEFAHFTFETPGDYLNRLLNRALSDAWLETWLSGSDRF